MLLKTLKKSSIVSIISIITAVLGFLYYRILSSEIGVTDDLEFYFYLVSIVTIVPNYVANINKISVFPRLIELVDEQKWRLTNLIISWLLVIGLLSGLVILSLLFLKNTLIILSLEPSSSTIASVVLMTITIPLALVLGALGILYNSNLKFSRFEMIVGFRPILMILAVYIYQFIGIIALPLMYVFHLSASLLYVYNTLSGSFKFHWIFWDNSFKPILKDSIYPIISGIFSAVLKPLLILAILTNFFDNNEFLKYNFSLKATSFLSIIFSGSVLNVLMGYITKNKSINGNQDAVTFNSILLLSALIFACYTGIVFFLFDNYLLEVLFPGSNLFLDNSFITQTRIILMMNISSLLFSVQARFLISYRFLQFFVFLSSFEFLVLLGIFIFFSFGIGISLKVFYFLMFCASLILAFGCSIFLISKGIFKINSLFYKFGIFITCIIAGNLFFVKRSVFASLSAFQGSSILFILNTLFLALYIFFNRYEFQKYFKEN